MLSLCNFLIIAGIGLAGMVLATILSEMSGKIARVLSLLLFLLSALWYLVIARHLLFRLGLFWYSTDGAWEAGGLHYRDMLCPTADKFLVFAWYSLTLNCVLIIKWIRRMQNKCEGRVL
jgi:hypothetical protein